MFSSMILSLKKTTTTQYSEPYSSNFTSWLYCEYNLTHGSNLTLPIHADAAVAAVLAGGSVACFHHQLPLAVNRGAMQITRVTWDVDIVICRETHLLAKDQGITNTAVLCWQDTNTTNVLIVNKGIALRLKGCSTIVLWGTALWRERAVDKRIKLLLYSSVDKRLQLPM